MLVENTTTKLAARKTRTSQYLPLILKKDLASSTHYWTHSTNTFLTVKYACTCTQARVVQQLKMLDTLAFSLVKQSEELREGLLSIQRWLRGGAGEGAPQKWQQKTLMQQGALELLQQLLEAMVSRSALLPV